MSCSSAKMQRTSCFPNSEDDALAAVIQEMLGRDVPDLSLVICGR